MRYLRMLSNSIVAGGTAAAYLVVLVLQINPALPLTTSSSWWLAATIWAAYGVNLAAACYALIVIRLVLATDPFSPGWFSVRVLSVFCAGAAVAATALMWLNLRGFRATLDDQAAQAMVIGAIAMTICAVAFVVLAILRFSVGQRGGRAGGLAVVVLMVASIGLPMLARGLGRPQTLSARRLEIGASAAERYEARVILLAIDGASLDVVSPAAADGRLPNFGRLLDAGATLHLATLRPTQPGPVLTAMATGKLPSRNGVRSAATFTAANGSDAEIDLLPDFCFAHGLVSAGLLTESMQNADSLRALPLWSILGQAGLASTIVRWPLTFPARPLLGSLVTDQYHRASEIALALEEPGVTYPTELAEELRSDPGDVASAETSRPSVVPGAGYPGDAPLALDGQYIAIADRLDARSPAPLLALRLQGLDTVSHYYLRQAMPRAFGDVSDEERRMYGQVLEQYYRFVDAEIGRLLDRLGPNDLLLVVSPFGMEPLSPAKRLLEHTLGNAALSGSHERAPDGFLMAFGGPVKQGRLPRGAVVDVTPTVLYFLGRPVGRDMDGFARTDLFTRDFTATRPIVYIPTYER
jgi:Type I phosphodiesterase / nucleotide pyrophosphatase